MSREDYFQDIKDNPLYVEIPARISPEQLVFVASFMVRLMWPPISEEEANKRNLWVRLRNEAASVGPIYPERLAELQKQATEGLF